MDKPFLDEADWGDEVPLDLDFLENLTETGVSADTDEDPLSIGEANCINGEEPLDGFSPVPVKNEEPEVVGESESDALSCLVFLKQADAQVKLIIEEAVGLLNWDPLEYHPFYVTVNENIMRGLCEGHLEEGDVNNLWKKYLDMGKSRNEAWLKLRSKSLPYSGPQSKYAQYLLQQRVRKQYQNSNAGCGIDKEKRFREVMRSAMKIREEWLENHPAGGSIKNDYPTILKFFCSCQDVTWEDYCSKMNNLWGQFFNRFREDLFKGAFPNKKIKTKRATGKKQEPREVTPFKGKKPRVYGRKSKTVPAKGKGNAPEANIVLSKSAPKPTTTKPVTSQIPSGINLQPVVRLTRLDPSMFSSTGKVSKRRSKVKAVKPGLRVKITKSNLPVKVTTPDLPVIVEDPDPPVIVEDTDPPVIVEEPDSPIMVEEPDSPVTVEEPDLPVIVEEPDLPVKVEILDSPVQVLKHESPSPVKVLESNLTIKVINPDSTVAVINLDPTKSRQVINVRRLAPVSSLAPAASAPIVPVPRILRKAPPIVILRRKIQPVSSIESPVPGPSIPMTEVKPRASRKTVLVPTTLPVAAPAAPAVIRIKPKPIKRRKFPRNWKLKKPVTSTTKLLEKKKILIAHRKHCCSQIQLDKMEARQLRVEDKMTWSKSKLKKTVKVKSLERKVKMQSRLSKGKQQKKKRKRKVLKLKKKPPPPISTELKIQPAPEETYIQNVEEAIEDAELAYSPPPSPPANTSDFEDTVVDTLDDVIQALDASPVTDFQSIGPSASPSTKQSHIADVPETESKLKENLKAALTSEPEKVPEPEDDPTYSPPNSPMECSDDDVPLATRINDRSRATTSKSKRTRTRQRAKRSCSPSESPPASPENADDSNQGDDQDPTYQPENSEATSSEQTRIQSLFSKYRELFMKCPICKKTKRFTRMATHIFEDHDKEEDPWQCPHCPKSYRRRDCWLVHLELKHEGVNIPEMLELTKQLNYEEKPNVPKEKCNHCEESFEPSYLPTHIIAKHTNERQFPKCIFCPEKSSHRQLWYHFCIHHAVHTEYHSAVPVQPGLHHPPKGTRPIAYKTERSTPRDKSGPVFWCEYCGDRFSKKHLLIRHHFSSHGIGEAEEVVVRYPCPHCGVSYQDKDYLTQHVRREHEKSLITACPHCSRRCQTPGKLWRHMVESHSISGTEAGEFCKVDWVACQYCGLEVLADRQLVNHVKAEHPEHLEEVVALQRTRDKEAKAKARRRVHERKLTNVHLLNKGHSQSEVDQEITPEMHAKMRSLGIADQGVCPECNQFIRAALCRHRQMRHGVDPERLGLTPCTFKGCRSAFREYRKYKEHVCYCHTNEVDDRIETRRVIKVLEEGPKYKVYQCSFCQEYFFHYSEVKVHLIADHPELFRDMWNPEEGKKWGCDHCDQFFDKETEMRDHIKELHVKFCLRCDGCYKLVMDEDDFDAHWDVYHWKGERRWFKTKVRITDGFRGINGANYHISYWNRHRVKCEVCGQSHSLDHINDHFRGIHGIIEDKGWFQCEFCSELAPYDYKHRAPFVRHLVNTHKDSYTLQTALDLVAVIQTKVDWRTLDVKCPEGRKFAETRPRNREPVEDTKFETNGDLHQATGDDVTKVEPKRRRRRAKRLKSENSLDKSGNRKRKRRENIAEYIEGVKDIKKEVSEKAASRVSTRVRKVCKLENFVEGESDHPEDDVKMPVAKVKSTAVSNEHATDSVTIAPLETQRKLVILVERLTTEEIQKYTRRNVLPVILPIPIKIEKDTELDESHEN